MARSLRGKVGSVNIREKPEMLKTEICVHPRHRRLKLKRMTGISIDCLMRHPDGMDIVPTDFSAAQLSALFDLLILRRLRTDRPWR
jgi:hypothetical protein